MIALLPWLGLVLLGIGMMQWGAARAAVLLQALRDRWGLPATAGGALMGIATAAPETAVNLSSAAFGWPDIGLGAALGSNVPALPLAVLLSWLATRLRPEAVPPPEVQPQVMEVQALPYLGVVLLLAALTLPPPIAGLQPVDGLVLCAAFAGYIAHALLRRPWVEQAPMPPGVAGRAAIGVPAIGLGALASVVGAQHVGAPLGVPDMVVGLFAIGLLCALPESWSAWRFTRDGKPTVAIAAVMGDGIVSLTVALLPLAVMGASVGDAAIYALNIGFLVAVLAAYAIRNHRRRGQAMGPGFVAFLCAGYIAYLGATAVLLRR
ncbi:sodium:calcium antiporter [Dankookia sp. P2]|uniref:sodium:calcium antiporter n=1 Tax=Dankookia sp. P2 TaxID=3423955 RepID=UPI003D669A49